MYRAFVLVCLASCGRFGFEDETTANPDACAVTASASVARANFHSGATFTANGGRAPYVFTRVSGPGTIAVDGELTTTDEPGSAVIAVVDSLGCSAQASIEVGGDSLFYVGGSSSSVPTADVLRSDDGITWTVVGALPAPRSSGALLVLHDRMYWLSGTNVSPEREVYSSSDGVLWTRIGMVPTAATSIGNVVRDGKMWMVGGNNNAGAVTSSTDGVTWTLVGDLPQSNHGGSLTVLGGNFIYAGGHDGNLFDWVLSSPDGVTWTRIGTLPAGREYHRAITHAGTMLLVGGQDTVPTPLPLVTATSDGSTFQTMPALPSGRANAGLAWFRDELWFVGGSNNAGIVSAPMGGAWSTRTTNFPTPRQSGGLVAFTPR